MVVVEDGMHPPISYEGSSCLYVLHVRRCVRVRVRVRVRTKIRVRIRVRVRFRLRLRLRVRVRVRVSLYVFHEKVTDVG